MKLIFFLIASFVFLTHSAFGQVRDSIGFSISRVPSFEKKNDLYEVRIINGKQDPICIMHSAYINLFIDPPHRLARVKKDLTIELFSLHYAARDTLNNYEYNNPSYNAEPVLPNQEIKFRILIPKSDQQQRLLFEYLLLPDFCYKNFKQAIFSNTANWYQKYDKKEVSFDLPK